MQIKKYFVGCHKEGHTRKKEAHNLKDENRAVGITWRLMGAKGRRTLRGHLPCYGGGPSYPAAKKMGGKGEKGRNRADALPAENSPRGAGKQPEGSSKG